ncbi:MAG: phospholipase D-like domain-containing protein [Chlamydiota bacterium]
MLKKSLFCGFVALLSFVYLHLLYFSLHPSLPQTGSPPLLYSNQHKTDLRLLLLAALEKAQSSIHLVMFGLTEPSILQKLAKKSSEEKVRCSIYYDPSASKRLKAPSPEVTIHPVFSKGLMHQKILVIDEQLIFLGSANMTKSSLQMHDNLVIGMVSPTIAQFLCDRTPEKSGYITATVGAQQVSLYLLPDPRGRALQAIKQRIADARESLKIAMFTFTHPGLVEAMIDAQKRGVSVEVSIDKNARYGSSLEAIQKLEEAGATIFTSPGSALMHHKFLMIDDTSLILGSANWTKAAFYKNHDSFVILSHMTPEQKSTMQTLWKKLQKMRLRS